MTELQNYRDTKSQISSPTPVSVTPAMLSRRIKLPLGCWIIAAPDIWNEEVVIEFNYIKNKRLSKSALRGKCKNDDGDGEVDEWLHAAGESGSLTHFSPALTAKEFLYQPAAPSYNLAVSPRL